MGDPWTQIDTIMAGMVIVSVSHHGEVVIAQARAPAVLIALRQRGVDRTAIIEGVNGFAMAGRICVVATSHRIHEPECPVITNSFNALSEAQREARSVRTAQSLEAAICNELNDPVAANDSSSAKQHGPSRLQSSSSTPGWLLAPCRRPA